MRLTSKEAAFLRGLGQKLKPQLHLGRLGLTPTVCAALEALFQTQELVKVRALKSAGESIRQLAARLAEETGAALVGAVGRTFVVYRPNPELDDPLRLPRRVRPTDAAGRDVAAGASQE